MRKELIIFLKSRIKLYDEEIKSSNHSEYDTLMRCHKLACKIEAYNEVINHLNTEKYLNSLKDKK